MFALVDYFCFTFADIFSCLLLKLTKYVKNAILGGLFLQYLLYALDFHQTFVISASLDKEEVIRFEGQKVNVQGHSMNKYAKNTIFGVCFCDISVSSR